LGVAWAFVLIGAIYTFFSYYKLSAIDAVIMTFLGALPGLFLVALLEYLIVGIERLEEMKKQTKLLEKLLQEKQSSTITDSVERS
jgi:uncharacterized membrane protein (DUF106 family)